MTTTDDATFFRMIAQASAEAALPYFRHDPSIENKADGGFDPVTEGDKAVERAIRELIGTHFPGHGILGEEYGLENPDSRYRWVIDPIDGTRAFICGLPVWGTLVGLLDDGDAIAGMMAQPFTKELFWAGRDGEGHYSGPNGERRLETRATETLDHAILLTTDPYLHKGADADAYGGLEAAVKLKRYGTDCYAYAMLAAGHVDVVCETGLHPYDIVGLIPLIERAGGVVTLWDGGAAEAGGKILASANQRLHEAALTILNR